jgi:hypothetical protein
MLEAFTTGVVLRAAGGFWTFEITLARAWRRGLANALHGSLVQVVLLFPEGIEMWEKSVRIRGLGGEGMVVLGLVMMCRWQSEIWHA